MNNMQDRTLVDILFFAEDNSHYGLNVIFQFDTGYLLFDSNKFSIATDARIYQLFKWKKVNY